MLYDLMETAEIDIMPSSSESHLLYGYVRLPPKLHQSSRPDRDVAGPSILLPLIPFVLGTPKKARLTQNCRIRYTSRLETEFRKTGSNGPVRLLEGHTPHVRIYV